MAKTRVTFRVPADLADALRHQPNQTAFVEAALREALARECPVCDGKGRVAPARLRVPDFRARGWPRLPRSAAQKLQGIVRLGRRAWATDLELEPDRAGAAWRFRLERRGELLLAGNV